MSKNQMNSITDRIDIEIKRGHINWGLHVDGVAVITKTMSELIDELEKRIIRKNEEFSKRLSFSSYIRIKESYGLPYRKYV